MNQRVLYSAFRRSADEGRLILRTTILCGERRLFLLDFAAVQIGGLFHVVGSDDSHSTTDEAGLVDTLHRRTIRGVETFGAFNSGLQAAIITTIAHADGTSASSVSFAGGPAPDGRTLSRLAARGTVLVMGAAGVAGEDLVLGEKIVSGFDCEPRRRAPVLVDGLATPEAWLAIYETTGSPLVYLEEPRLQRATPLWEVGGYRAEGGRLVDAAELAQQAETVRAFAASRFVEVRR